jgi:hypothetical protein
VIPHLIELDRREQALEHFLLSELASRLRRGRATGNGGDGGFDSGKQRNLFRVQTL